MERELKPLPVAGNMVALSTNVSYVNNPVCLTMTVVPFILLPPPTSCQPGCPVLASLSLIPAFIVHVCYACQKLCCAAWQSD